MSRSALIRRATVAAIALLATGALTGCYAQTGPYTDSITATTATGHASVSCNGGSPNPCYYWFHVYKGQGAWTGAMDFPGWGAGGHGPITANVSNASVPENFSNLEPNSFYNYQLCGWGDAVSSVVCLGPGGGVPTQLFHTALPIQPPAQSSPIVQAVAPCTTDPASGDPISDNALGSGDYILTLPSTPLGCALGINGGNNVVVTGGEITVPLGADWAACVTQGGTTTPDYTACQNEISSGKTCASCHAGIVLDGSTKHIWLEGLKLDGPGLGDGIVINDSLAGQEVDLINTRIDGLNTPDAFAVECQMYGVCAQTVGGLGAPAYVHPDCIATEMGPAVLKVDGMTCTTDYFGFQFSPYGFQCTGGAGVPAGCVKNQPPIQPNMSLSRVNITDDCLPNDGSGCGFTRDMMWINLQNAVNGIVPSGATVPQITTTDVWPTVGGYGQSQSQWLCALNQVSTDCSTLPGWPWNLQGNPAQGDFVPDSPGVGAAGIGYVTPGATQ